MSVTYMQAGVEKIKNVIPQICKFGGTMRTTKRETMEKMAVELKNELRAICEVYGATYKSDIKISWRSSGKFTDIAGSGS